MKKLYCLLLFVALIANSAFGARKMSLKDRIATLPATKIEKIKCDTMFSEAWEFAITQPLDHNNPSGKKFHQQVFLNYVGPDAPVVVVTEGYSVHRNYTTELAQLLHCNQIIIEHRYFDESVPDSLDWKYLTAWQSAADQHDVIELFKPVFHGKWISTGISNGGENVMFHSFYYPKDVDVRVAYVGPLNFGPEDPRMASFLANDGTPECRNKVYEFQKLALEKFDVLFPMMQKLAEDKKWTFNRIGSPQAAFEMSVLEFEFAFWQWGYACDKIPLSGTDKEIFDFLSTVGDFSYFADQGIIYFEPFFYQALTQIGYYGYQFDRFKGLLRYASDNGKPEFLFSAPKDVTLPPYDYKFAHDVDKYIKTKARHFIFLYGEYDPWSASAADPGSNKSCLKIINPGGSHGTRIMNLPPEKRDLVMQKLKEWLGVKINPEAIH
jgi:hypothetical protein